MGCDTELPKKEIREVLQYRPQVEINCVCPVGFGVPREEQAEQGDASDVSGRPVLLDRDAEEEGRDVGPQKIHRPAQKRKRFVVV